jgi:integrase
MASELRIFLPQLGPRMLERSEGDERPSRDRIIGDIGVFVGLRVDEVYSLSKYQFLALTPPADGPVGDQQVLVKGKGGKTRPVAFPNWLVLDIQAYISTERAKAVDDGGLTGRNDPAALLVSGSQAKAPGRGLSRRRLQQIVELACIRAGLVQRRSWRDPETGESFVRETAKHCFHDLRHTYAVLTYWAEKAGGNSEPWKKIQAQLGHEHLKTTIDTYLSFVEIFGDRESLLDVRRLIGLTG